MTAHYKFSEKRETYNAIQGSAIGLLPRAVFAHPYAAEVSPFFEDFNIKSLDKCEVLGIIFCTGMYIKPTLIKPGKTLSANC